MGILTANGKVLIATGKFLLAVAGAGSGPNPPPADPPPADPPPPTDNGAGTVTLSEASLLDYQVYQHAGGTKAVPVSGTVSGSDGVVEARIIDESGVQLVAWTTVGTSSGGSFSGSIVMPKGATWGKVQARKVTNPGSTTVGTKRFGVGEWVVLAGQSNMEHLWTSYATYPLSSSKVRGIEVKSSGGTTIYGRAGTWNDAYPPGTLYGNYPSYTSGDTDGGDGFVLFANQMSANLGCVIGVAAVAIGGTSIEEWQPGQPRWNNMIAALNTVGGDCGTVLWYQGENNSGDTSAAYNTKLDAIRNGMYTQTGRTSSTLAFGVVALGPCTTYGAEGAFGSMRSIQIAYAAKPGCFLAGSAADCSAPSGDTVHINNASQQRMGRRYAKSLTAYLAGSPKPGPKIASASRNGATITVSITGGTGALKDGAGGNGGSLQGFRVFDNGVAATISGTTISGSTVVLTLASAPSGTVTLDYAMANAPYGGTTTPAPAAIVYDSDTVPGDTLGLPLLPCATITVA